MILTVQFFVTSERTHFTEVAGSLIMEANKRVWESVLQVVSHVTLGLGSALD